MFKEIALKISIADSKESAGILLTNEKSKNLIISVHGLTGTGRNYISLKTRDYITENNLDYDMFRFEFYNESEMQRSFLNTTIETQISDLNSIINYFADRYENIYLQAMSYGGLTAAALNSAKITKQILVDPSFIIDLQWQNANTKTLQGGEVITLDHHMPTLFNKEMKTEGLAWSASKSQQIISNITSPTLIIQANSIHYKLGVNLDYSNNNILLKYFENADHSFTYLNACEKMLIESFNFLNLK